MNTKEREFSTTEIVRETYAQVARESSGCGCSFADCMDTTGFAKSLGYSDEEIELIPGEANLGLSCGNPTAVTGLKAGETVLDLGSGAGFDCFLAAARVGPEGKVIGVDMTPEMIEKSRMIGKRDGFKNVEFRLGEIESLPVADNSIDVVISNCVINLSADKKRVFSEIARVLKPGGRVSISDVALKKDLPETLKDSPHAYACCIAGAVRLEQYRELVEKAGLKDIRFVAREIEIPETNDPISRIVIDSLGPGETIGDYVVSVNVEAAKF